MTERDGETSNTLRERAGRNKIMIWLLVEANRNLVVVALLGAVFLVLVGVGVAVPGTHELLGRGDPVETAFQAFVTATITGVTLVVTLNQLVLSQDLGGIGDQRERMETALAFRRETADLVDEPVTPPDPAAFLQTLVKTARTLATTLTADLPPDADDVLQDQMSHLATEIESNANAVEPRLAEAQFGSFDTISAALDFDYSWKLYAARRIRRVHGDALDEEATTQLDDLIDTLERFGPAREHVKTLYFRWELVNLSWMVIATAIPALTVAVCTLLYYDTRLLVGSIAGIPASVLVVSGAVTVSLTPFVVLLAYILRIATISKRTLSIGPFTLRPTDRGEFEADGG